MRLKWRRGWSRDMKNIAADIFHLEDIFEEGWRVFTAIFAKCIPLVIAFGFVSNFLSGLTCRKLGLDALIAAGGKEGKMALKAAATIDKFFTFLIFSIAIMAVVKCAERVVTQREWTVSEAFGEGLRRWPRYLWTRWLAGLIIFGMLLLLIIPGFIWAVYYSFVPYVIAVTSLSGKAALDYSKSLVKGSFWRTIGYLFVIGVAASIPTVILAMAGKIVAGMAATGRSELADIAIEALATSVAALPMILQFSLTTVFFLNTAYLKRGLKG